MPYKSDKQRAFLHSQKPDVAAKFDADEKESKGSMAIGMMAGKAGKKVAKLAKKGK